jgi:Fic family protein
MKPPYEITNKILSHYGQITEALGQCKSLLLVKPEARLRKQNRIKTIHSSLAIEGNTLDIEHVTALMGNSHVLGPKKDILEVRNAIKTYDKLSDLNPYSINDFLKAHKLLMDGLAEKPGQLRRRQVGILKGSKVQHMDPGYSMVPGLMDDLFDYLRNDSDIDIIKSCVFHYEIEFIHPFEDGNGRLGRFWQTRILMEVNPLFEYVPIEEAIKNDRESYYQALEDSDNSGKSTIFIEFMLEIINRSLRKTIEESNSGNIDYRKRTEYALSMLNDWFGRKEYMKINKGISTATASRDLRQLLNEGKIESQGNRRMTRYKKVD